MSMSDLSSYAMMFSNSNAGGKMPKKKKSAPKMQSYTYKAKDGSLQRYTNSSSYQKKVGNVAAGKQAAKEKIVRSKPKADKTAGMPNAAQRTDTTRGMPNKAQATNPRYLGMPSSSQSTAVKGGRGKSSGAGAPQRPSSAAQVRAQESGKNRSGGSAASKRKMESSSGMAGPKVTPRNIASARAYEGVKPKNTGSARAFEGVKRTPVGSARSVEQPRTKAATARTGSVRGVESPSTPKKYGSARSVEQPYKKDRSNTSAAARRKMESRSR
jgi:hypothetical protein